MKKIEKKNWIGIASIALIVLLSVGAYFLLREPLLSFIGSNEESPFRTWMADKGAWGVLAFIGMVVLQVVIALIPGEPFEIAAGAIFGVWLGTLWCMVAAMIGSALVFWMVRLFGKKLVNLFFPDKDLDNLRFLNTSQKRDVLFFVLMMIPGTPKDLLSYIAGLTKIKFLHWMAIVAVARIPSVITSVIVGDRMGERDYLLAGIALGATLAISGVGILIYRRILKKEKEENPDETKPAAE